MKEQELSALKESAVYSAAHWAKTGFGYFTMRDKVNAYIDTTGIKQTKRCPNIVLPTFGQRYNANRKLLLRLNRRNVRPAVTAFVGCRLGLNVLALLLPAALRNLLLNLLDVLIVELRGL